MGSGVSVPFAPPGVTIPFLGGSNSEPPGKWTFDFIVNSLSGLTGWTTKTVTLIIEAIIGIVLGWVLYDVVQIFLPSK